MIEIIKEQVKEVKQRLTKVRTVTISSRNEISKKVKTLTEFSSKYEKAWAGSWYNEDYNLYHDKFDPSVESCKNIDENFIIRDILKHLNIDLNKIKKEDMPNISSQFFGLKEFVLSELSFIKGIEVYKNEEEILKQIEDFIWGVPLGQYSHMAAPKYAYGYDSASIINNINKIPPHISLMDELVTHFSVLQSYDNFENLVNRLIRLLEIKSLSGTKKGEDIAFQIQVLYAIINKFHLVATQLKNRYGNRQSLLINDEYDVQDLMSALLRINFEDVRKEEYTPSYAGSSTRIDFLLKREKILIEVKKTRRTLKDREIGKELIIDIAYYKSHPDCNHLICFVYDADNLILNPRGVEDDLNKLTTEDFLVEAFIRP